MKQVTGRTFYLDDNITGYFSGKENSLFEFSLTTARFSFDPSKVTDLGSQDFENINPSFIQKKQFNLSNVYIDTSLDKTRLTFDSDFDITGSEMYEKAVWTIHDISGVEKEYWSTVNVSEEDGGTKYKILGLKYDFDKYGYVESGLSLIARSQNNEIVNPPVEDGISNLIFQMTRSDNGDFDLAYSFVKNGEAYKNMSTVLLYKKNTGFLDTDFFGENYLQYIGATHGPQDTDGELTFSDNGLYYFRIYNLNEDGTLGTSYSEFVTGINYLFPIKNLIVHSLCVDGNIQANDYAQLFTGLFTGGNPRFVWEVGSKDKNVYPSEVFFRVTVREPSLNNLPSSFVYFQRTGLKFNFGDSYNFTYLMDFNNTSINGPHRSFDLVVEAHDAEGNSSAGKNFSSYINSSGFGDSDYSIVTGKQHKYRDWETDRKSTRLNSSH